MLRAGIHRHGRLLGNRRKALFILENLIHRDHASNIPHEANAFWIKYFGTYNYMTENNYSEEMASYYRRSVLAVQNLWGRSRFVNKNLQNCMRVGLLNSIFPDAKFINIIRDGRAVAFSIVNKKEFGVTPTMFLVGLKNILGDKYQSERSELYNYGLAWAELVKRAREASAFGQNRYYEVRYENLITEPHNELRSIIDFCELDWHSELEEKVPPTQNKNEKWKQKASKEQRIDLEESTFELRRSLDMVE
jgi:hypothetical protein